ncbi:hypothetical protein F1331_25740 [Salmonella enterica subsp. enterica serovar Dessau]|uniref:Uncharacterized protein n=1 Tax=Salmonella enterica subsp. enterica serovar Dessau TaxID=2564349 RepID=A0A8E5IMH7_SALET|nr:hypothetical protein F1331_25740 [Salmonella enterica subsp. enterica serovar Dessau]
MEAKEDRLGRGQAYVPEEMVADDLEKGNLSRAMQSYSQSMEGSILYYPQRNVSPEMRVVIDIMKI